MKRDSCPFDMEDYTEQEIKEYKFKKVCEDMQQIYIAKNKDYGDSFSKLYAKYGMIYPIIHMQEKLNRIEALQEKNNDVKGETYIDSLKDLANYAILTLIEIDKANK